MNKKITLLDGAWGTLLWEQAKKQGISADPVWSYNMTHPELVADICRSYKEAGSEIIFSNTFSANRFTVGRESAYSVKEVITAGVKIAKEALNGTGVRVALDVGPIPLLTEPYGDLEEDETEEIYDEIIQAGAEAGADCIFLETFMQLEMLVCAVKAAKKTSLPVFCSMSFEPVGKTLFGVSIEDMLEEIEPLGVEAVGLNCSLGPVAAYPVIREFAENTDLPLIFKPNAGTPAVDKDGKTYYSITPEEYSREIALSLENSRIDYLGGCCGTNPDFIKKLKELL